MASNMLHACVLLAALAAGDCFLPMPNLVNKPLRFAVSLLDGEDGPSTVTSPAHHSHTYTVPAAYEKSQTTTFSPEPSTETGIIRKRARPQKKWKSNDERSLKTRGVKSSAFGGPSSSSEEYTFGGKAKYGASNHIVEKYTNWKPGFAGSLRYNKKLGKHSRGIVIRPRSKNAYSEESEEEYRDGRTKQIKVKAVASGNVRGQRESDEGDIIIKRGNKPNGANRWYRQRKEHEVEIIKKRGKDQDVANRWNRQREDNVIVIAKRRPVNKKYKQFKNDYLPAGQTKSGEITSEELTSGEISSGEFTSGEITSGDVTSEEISGESRWNYRDGRKRNNNKQRKKVKAVAMRQSGGSQNTRSRDSVFVRRNKQFQLQRQQRFYNRRASRNGEVTPYIIHKRQVQQRLYGRPRRYGDDTPNIIRKVGPVPQCDWCPSG